jgi:hypothetical protein
MEIFHYVHSRRYLLKYTNKMHVRVNKKVKVKVKVNFTLEQATKAQ